MKKKWDKLGSGNHYSVVIPAPTKHLVLTEHAPGYTSKSSQPVINQTGAG